MKNKSIIAFIIIFIMMAILTVIIIKQEQDIKHIKREIGIEDTEKQEEANEISKTDFIKYIKQIDITTDNWKDFFEVEESKEDERNAFNDIVDTQRYITFKLNNNYYDIGELENVALEVEVSKEKADVANQTFNNSKTIQFYEGNNKMKQSALNWIKADKSVTIDDFKCTRATGTLYYLDNIPDKYWNIEEGMTVGEKNEQYINVEGTKYYKYHSNYIYLKDFIE